MEKFKKKWKSFKIVFVYFIIGVLWILFSDKVLSYIVTDADRIIKYGTFKGWFYVFCTSLLLYFLIKAQFDQIEKKNKKFENSEDNNRLLFNMSPIGLALSNMNGSFLDVNPAFAKIIGKPIDEILKLTYRDITFDKYDAQEALQLKSLEKTGHYGPYETEYIHSDGYAVQVVLNGSIIERDGEKYIWSSIENIAKRKLTDKALKESEERFKYAMKASKDGLFDWNLETNEIYYSPRWKKILGYDDNELPNDFSVWEKSTNQDDVKKSWELQQKLISKQIERFVLEFKMKHKDGHWVDILSQAEAVCNDNGKAIRIVGTHTDITERKKAEQELINTKEIAEENEYKFKAYSQNSTIAIYTTDANGDCIYANSKWLKIAGLTFEESLGKGWLKAIHPEDKNYVKENWYKSVQSNGSWFFEYRFKTPKGKVTYVEGTAKPVYNKENKLIGYLGSNFDLTERKKAEKKIIKLNQELELRVKERTQELEKQTSELKESQDALLYLLEDMNESKEQLSKSNEQLEMANKEMEAFSYSVSHDLRAPLTRLDGFSTILTDLYKHKLDVKGVHYLNRIRASSSKMEQLINDMLSLSRISRQEISKSMVDISEVSKKIINVFKISDPKRNVKVKIKDSIKILCDPKLIGILLENILSNAWKFTSKNTKASIEIGTKVINNKKVIFIKDNGVGFDSTYVEKVFLPFQRLHTESEFEGTGIGMATVKRIIKRHNAEIWGESKLGEGSTFYLVF